MEFARWLDVFAGVVLILATFYDLFKSVVLPRPAINKFVSIREVFFLPGDDAWEHFSNALEVRFGPDLLAARLAIIPAQRIGDRSYGAL